MEANLGLSSFVLEWFRIMFPLLVNFGQFIKIHHPLSPLLLRSFIEVFAALATLIGFVGLASVMISIISCVILKLMLDLVLRIVSMMFHLRSFFRVVGSSLHFITTLILFVSKSLTWIAYAMDEHVDNE